MEVAFAQIGIAFKRIRNFLFINFTSAQTKMGCAWTGVTFAQTQWIFLIFFKKKFKIFWLVLEGLDFWILLLLNGYSSQDCSTKKYFAKSSYHVSLANGMVDGGPASMQTLVEFFSSFESPYLEEKWSAFEVLFCFLVKYWRWKCFLTKKIGIPLIIFPWQMQMLMERWDHAADGSISHIWSNNDWIWAFFFFMDRHLT